MGILEKLHRVNKARSLMGFGFDLKEWSLGEWGCAVAGEAGEMCNVIKKIGRGDYGKPGQYTPEVEKHLGHEMADIIIYLDLIAHREGIDLPAMIAEKFNEVSHKKGVDLFIDV